MIAGRLGFSLVASVILHAALAATITWSLHRSSPTREPSEPLIVTSSRIHLVQRSAKPRDVPPAPPHRAAISAPAGWATQDIGFEGVSDVTLWLDWKHQGANVVPRVFLWQRHAVTADGRKESLQAAVAEILDLLRTEKDTLYVSKPQRVCDGTRPGWFFSYVKPWDDPPLRYEETITVAGDTIDRATYSRPDGQSEDPYAREALNSLC